MSAIPRDKSLDMSIPLLRNGFTFIPDRCREYRSDLFRGRLLGMPVVCMSGPEAASVFYDPDNFIRKGAIPKRIQKTLLGENGVQTLDADRHRHRKEMFMSMMTPGSLHQLQGLMIRYWQQYATKWTQMPQVRLFTEAQEILCRTACAWAGVPLAEGEVRQRARDFTAMVDAFGAIGPRHWRGRRARSRTEKWVMRLIKKVRRQQLVPQPGSPLAIVAWHQEPDGKLLDRHLAAVELINVLRPIVAISWYITFAALALHQYPDYKARIAAGEPDFTELFVQEVRRFYPFGPFVGARVRQNFGWRGHEFKKGLLVFLDIYGTNHDERSWQEPHAFRPDRFRHWNGSPFSFMPQGGGDFFTGHRCAGEWVTIELTKVGVECLAKGMQYEVPGQDLSFSLSRMPTYPKSGFIMKQVRVQAAFEAPVQLSACPFHQK
jgi:fatty-acid peroxygenase